MKLQDEIYKIERQYSKTLPFFEKRDWTWIPQNYALTPEFIWKYRDNLDWWYISSSQNVSQEDVVNFASYIDIGRYNDREEIRRSISSIG